MKKGEFMAKKLNQYKHALLFLYFPFYLMAFAYVEKRVPDKIHVIHCVIDRYIPFLEVFIIPYLLWFLYIAVTGFYFFFKEKEVFCRLMYFGMAGMTIFIIVSYFYPNGLELRPTSFSRDNIFIELTKLIYRADTPTNVLPSIHVFNSLGAYSAIRNSRSFHKNKPVRIGALVLTIAIILSTIFLKQHSVVDVFTAVILSSVVYDFVYHGRLEKIQAGMEGLGYKKLKHCLHNEK